MSSSPMGEKYILGRVGFYFGGFGGEAKLILGIWGAKANTFRELRIFLRDLGRSMHYF